MKKTAPRISDQAAEFLPTMFPSLNGGCESVIDAFPNLYRRTLNELKGKFTDSELKLLIDIHNGHLMIPVFAGQALYAQCEDAINLNHVDQKWAINKSEFLKKISGLTSFQSTVIEIWATGFWYSEVVSNKKIEAYIKSLT